MASPDLANENHFSTLFCDTTPHLRDALRIIKNFKLDEGWNGKVDLLLNRERRKLVLRHRHILECDTYVYSCGFFFVFSNLYYSITSLTLFLWKTSPDMLRLKYKRLNWIDSLSLLHDFYLDFTQGADEILQLLHFAAFVPSQGVKWQTTFEWEFATLA